MKTGTITHYIEIPVEVTYSLHPAERQTMTYPGCQEHIEIEDVEYPDELALNQILYKDPDAINEACLEDAKE